MLNRVMSPAPALGPFEMPETIATKRATLRVPVPSDASVLSKQAGDYDIAKMTGTIPHPLPKVSAEIWLMLNQSARYRGLQFNYAICPQGIDDVRGIAGICKNSAQNWELGCWISRSLWGQGYATEAAGAVIAAFMDVMGPVALHAGVFSDNPASARVLQAWFQADRRN